jgi:MFS family permease
MLVLFRIFQGLAGGPLMPLSQTLLLRIFPKEKAGAAIGLWSMTTLIAPILGPILGGVLCDNWSWPLIFYINVPVALICVITSNLSLNSVVYSGIYWLWRDALGALAESHIGIAFPFRIFAGITSYAIPFDERLFKITTGRCAASNRFFWRLPDRFYTGSSDCLESI